MSIADVAQFKGAQDKPDDKDFSALHLFGDPIVDIPGSIDLNNVLCHDQGRTYHCTAYGLTHIIEILNTLEFTLEAMADPEEQWTNQKVDRGSPDYMESEGDSLQHALQVLLQKGLNNKTPAIKIDKFKIDGYARIDKTVDSLRKWLALGFPVYTGSGAHCYALVGYSDTNKTFTAKNSFGPTWGPFKNGTFTVGYNEIDKLFSTYILYDHKDLQMIYKDVSVNSPMAIAIKFCLDKGFMKGYGLAPDPVNRLFLPEKPVTRAEIAQILFNIYGGVPQI